MNQRARNTNYQKSKRTNITHNRQMPEPKPDIPAIVMPPGSDCPTAYNEIITYYQEDSPSCASDFASYLEPYKGTYLSLEFGAQVEISGILKEIGRGFIVLEDPDTLNLTVADMRHILFVRLFCRK